MEQTWKDIYNRKLITAAQAAAMVQNGDSFCAVTREPKTILRELGKRKDLKNVTYYCSQTNFLGELMGLQNEVKVLLSFMDGTGNSWKTAAPNLSPVIFQDMENCP